MKMCTVLTYLDDRRDIMAISLDATLQSETKVLQSQSCTRWMCGVRAPSVYSDPKIVGSYFLIQFYVLPHFDVQKIFLWFFSMLGKMASFTV